MKLFFPLLLVIITSLSSLFAQDPFKEKGLQAINTDVIKAQLEFLSSDYMEGRRLGEKGEYLAGEYIASMLKFNGIKPAGDYIVNGQDVERSYFQNFSLLKSKPSGEQVMQITIKNGTAEKTIKYEANVDFRNTVSTFSYNVEAPIIFVGYGLNIPNSNHNDLKGLDLKGKFVLRLNEIPANLDKQLTNNELRQYTISSEQEMLNAGAVGIIDFNLVSSVVGRSLSPEFTQMSPSESTPSPYYEGVRYSLPASSSPKSLFRVSVSTKVATDLLNNTNINIDHYIENPSSKQFSTKEANLGDKTVYLKNELDVERVNVRNVLGMIEGKDPNSIIVVGGHYDHMGIKDGYIWNGADDNGSGTVAVMTLAKAIAATGEQPDKTIIFALWTSEEEGLFGSKYYVQNLDFPLDHLKLNLNFDMISRYISDDEPNKVNMTFNTSCPMFKDYTIANNQKYNIGLDVMFQPSDYPTAGTDQRSFVEVGIPIMRFKPGHREEYHTPYDEISTIDWDIMEKIIKISFTNLWDVANNDWEVQEEISEPDLRAISR